MIAALTPTFAAVTSVMGAVVAQNVFFYLIAAVMVIAALRVVTTSNMVHAALYLVVVLAGVAAQFLLLGAEFVGITQVLVYIGAVIVLFLFGIMLTRAKVGAEEGLNHDSVVPAILTAVLLLLVMGFAVVNFAATGGGEVAGLVFVQPHGEAADDGTRISVPREVKVFENPTAAIESQSFETGVPFGPMDGALVSLVDSDGETVARMTTSENGRYHFDGLDTDEYDVVVSQPAVDDADTATATVSVNKVKEIDVLNNQPTTVEQVSDSIFSTYIVAFEAISVLLLAALIGAIVVARKE